jgi:D-arabinose 1-dehydrogenase-like Zn-dependent alcohol dehydrogenase
MATGNTLAYAAKDKSGKLEPFSFDRREVGPKDVAFDVKFCGICHSDLHQIKDEWTGSLYPMVPGHELAGVVTKVGSEVTKFKVGQHVGVGCMVGSCHACDAFEKHLEQYCPDCKWTYNCTYFDGTPCYGGYSNKMVCDEKFVLSIPDNLPLDRAAPLMCAGITVYSPMVHFGMTEKAHKLGVVGLGGLGHMAVLLGKAFGLHVTVLSTSPSKKQEALEVLKADNFVVTKDAEEMKSVENSLDYIIDTVSAKHDIASYLSLLKVDGKLAIVGVPPEPLSIPAGAFIFGRKSVGGSLIGGIQETQEMLDFCSKHNVLPLIEKIPFSYVNTAMERLVKQDIKYRFVLDCSTLSESQ